MKSSFVMYQMWEPMISAMKPEDAGGLLKAIFAYAASGEAPDLSEPYYPMFALIKAQMDKDAIRYEEVCEKRRENGAKGGRPKNQTKAKETNRFLEKPNVTKSNLRKHDSDSDSDSDSDIDSDSGFDTEKDIYKNLKDSCSDLSPKGHEPEADVEAVILNTGAIWRPTVSQYEEYVRLYPAVDIDAEFRKIRAWCIGNPKKRKTKGGITRFVNSWLSKEQDKSSGAVKGSAYIEAIKNRVSIVDSW